MALVITPRGDFGYLPHLQGFKVRFETVFWLGPVPTAGYLTDNWRRHLDYVICYIYNIIMFTKNDIDQS